MSAQHTPGPLGQVFAFECRFGEFARTVNAAAAGKARYDYLLDLRDSYPDATFADIRVRTIGPAQTSEAFLRTARYRGMPDLRCGEAVTVNGRPGFVVGHNDSANFDVLFADGDWKGATLNVHPSELRRACPSEAHPVIRPRFVAECEAMRKTLNEAEKRALNRRFTGAAVTGFGVLA